MSELQYGLDEVLPAGPGDHTNAHDTHYGRQRRALYRLLQPIGNGTQSTIRLAQFLPTGEFFAVKAYSRSPRNSPIDPTVPSVETLVSRKLRIFGLVSQNPHVVKFYEHFATEQKHYFVFELCKGKSLQHYLDFHGGKVPEKEAKEILRTLFLALSDLHANGIVHRDIKPSNMLIRDPTRPAEIVLADFGSAYVVEDSDFNPVRKVELPGWTPTSPSNQSSDSFGASPFPSAMKTVVGSPFYLSPEIVLGQSYGAEVDCWSAGCCAYQLLFGMTPFQTSASFKHLYDRIVSEDVTFPLPLVPNQDTVVGYVSPEAKDFVRGLLCRDPSMRQTAAGALRHPWLADGDDSDESQTRVEVEGDGTLTEESGVVVRLNDAGELVVVDDRMIAWLAIARNMGAADMKPL